MSYLLRGTSYRHVEESCEEAPELQVTAEKLKQCVSEGLQVTGWEEAQNYTSGDL